MVWFFFCLGLNMALQSTAWQIGTIMIILYMQNWDLEKLGN